LIAVNCLGNSCASPLTQILLTSFVVNSVFWANRLIHKRTTLSGAVSCVAKSPFVSGADCSKVKIASLTLIKSEKRDLLAAVVTAVLVWKNAGALAATLAFFIYFFYCDLLPLLFTNFPGSFTFGEGCLVLQSAIAYAFISTEALIYSKDKVTSAEGSFVAIARICLLSVIAMVALPFIKVSSCFKSPTFFFAYGTAFFMAITYPLLWTVLKRNPIIWMVTYIAYSPPLLLLLVSWASLVIAALATVKSQTTKANTRTRKIFHVLVVAVHVSGAAVDIYFTSMASQLVLGIFILLEFVRTYKIEPLSSILNSAFALFIDEKDRGALVLTNIYLLVGTFAPVWIASHPHLTSNHLSIYSGVLSVGIGDAVASVVGSMYGRTKWPGTFKTVEGTLASVAAQLAFVGLWAAATHFEFNAVSVSVIVGSITISSVMEALTQQVDNLVLPLTLYIMLSFL